MKEAIACYELAESKKLFGLSNYLQDRITAHSKLNWMLGAIILKKST
jgi:DNA-binding ferritin-like protein